MTALAHKSAIYTRTHTDTVIAMEHGKNKPLTKGEKKRLAE